MKQVHTNKIGIFYDPLINEGSFNDRHLEQIRAAAPHADVIVIKDPDSKNDEILARCIDTEIFFGTDIKDWIKILPDLKWVQVAIAGVDWLLDDPDIAGSDAAITNASGVHAIPVSEHVLAIMLSFCRNMNVHFKDQMNRKWRRLPEYLELSGSTIGIIGIGKIGEKIAETAKALGMKVLGLRRNPERTSPCVDRMFGPVQLLEMLPACDWIVISAAATKETGGMIGAPEFNAMKKSAHIINIARGALIKEDELIKALREGRIAGAGLDVFEKEPIEESSPFWELPNVIITPHVAAGTPYYIDRLVDIFCENIRRYYSGEPLINLVDRKLGY
jgi:phosphoglycerate dehydrogenase-like enzyme